MYDIIEATRQSEKQLTIIYGMEASTAIERFETLWNSFEAYKDPSIQSEVAIGPYLDYTGWERIGNPDSDESWFFSTSIAVKTILVYEYTPDRLKAGACVERASDEMTPQGDLVKSLPPREICGIYVFVRTKSEAPWKLAGYFNTNLPYSAIRRDWYQMPEWLREVMGDLPDELPEPNGK